MFDSQSVKTKQVFSNTTSKDWQIEMIHPASTFLIKKEKQSHSASFKTIKEYKQVVIQKY